jgi:hypothetical protein
MLFSAETTETSPSNRTLVSHTLFAASKKSSASMKPVFKTLSFWLVVSFTLGGEILLNDHARIVAQENFSGSVDARSTKDVTIQFNRDIRPLLSDRCFYCHGPDSAHREADLRLDIESAAKESAIVPGDLAASDLVFRILTDDPDLQMPPPDSGKSLSHIERQLLQDWIAKGAHWEEHWSFVPPVKHDLPVVQQTDWPLNWLDRFTLARLETEQLAPSEVADRVTLLRRLCFDLNGLPPTEEQSRAFLEDTSPDAYEHLVDQLLESPRYGERMAMYWLDLVRFADTVGYHGDQDHNISPYRDYVIDALNANLPFDQFTREQLAGDLLDNPTISQKIATGYNRLLQTSHEGGVQPQEYLAIYAADRVRNLSNVWMGSTMGCCQCHDHKFDPFTIKDFYSMASFFADVDEAQHFKTGTNELPTSRPPEIVVYSAAEQQRKAEMETRLGELLRVFGERGTTFFKERDADRKQQAAWQKKNAAAKQKNQPLQPQPPSLITIELTVEEEQHVQEIDRLVSALASLERGARRTMVTASIEPREMRVLPRGNWMDHSGPIVTPQIPEFLGALPGEARATRLDLANWLVDRDQGFGGMTARVFANRFWYLLFNVGFSSVLEDLGGQGEPPTHPELLDNLAIEFIESGWDVKHMLKLIVMSRTYQQSSIASAELLRRDPENRLFARQSQFRLPAEMIRDNALAISGLLVLENGGASVKPYQPAGYYRHLNFPVREYAAHHDQRQWRRGVYVHWQRQFLHPMLKAFDAPSREECTARRPRSNTPLAAMILLNDPTFIEAARVFAANILSQRKPSFSGKLAYAFHKALNRAPSEFESEILSTIYDTSLREFTADPDAAHELISTGDAPAAESVDPIEHAAWTSVARTILNLSETNSRF